MTEAKTMRAATYTRKGPAEETLVITTLPLPEVGPNDVRVRVIASGVNPSDVKSRSGIFDATMPYPIVVPHSDGAGIVDAVGPGVRDVAVGDRVFTYNAQYLRAFGTAAAFVVLPSDLVVALPETTTFAEGACLGIPAMTAHRAVHIGDPVAGRTVLVAGGAGAVGAYAIQFAKAAGARVIATVSSQAKAGVALEMGADVCIDYRSDDVAERVRAETGGRGVDRVVEVDVATNGPLYPRIVAIGGTVAVYGSSRLEATLPVTAFFRRDLTLCSFLVYQLPADARVAAIADITYMLRARELRHHIAATFPLAEIASAHRMVEAGLAGGGNVVLDVDRSIDG